MDITEIVTGGDERIILDEKGLNKYFVNPLVYKDTFSRGSCTCSTLSDNSKKAIEKIIDRLETEEYDDVLKEQKKKLKEFIGYKGQDTFDIFYAPSGSDLCYYPILFSKIIYPKKDIFNILTCAEELGTGSNTANNGRHHGALNQFGEQIQKGELIHPDIKIKQASFSARDEEGNIANHKDKILQTIEDNEAKNSIITHLVIGSKSGIMDNISIIPRVQKDIFWVVDVCQLRATKKLINSLINLNCMVMITGSKFYQSPPFCGALLVPKTITSRLKNITDEAIAPFLDIFGTSDIPFNLPELRNKFRENDNTGTLVRWEAAVNEMSLLSYYGESAVTNIVEHWNAFVISQLQFSSDYFELMPGQQITNPSIISFSVKKPDGTLLDDIELKELFMKICLTERDNLGDYKRVIIGQPVKYENKSFIRLALGSYNVRKLISTSMDFSYDRKLVEIIIEEVKLLFWK